MNSGSANNIGFHSKNFETSKYNSLPGKVFSNSNYDQFNNLNNKSFYNSYSLHGRNSESGNYSQNNKTYSSLDKYSRESFCSERIPVSLINYGANCYLNSGLQAISACSNFVKDLNDCQMKNPNFPKLKTLNNLIKILCYGNKKYVDLSRDEIFAGWNKTGQQDSFELLAFIVNQVYKEFKKLNEVDDWLKVQLPMRIILEHHITCCSKYGGHNVMQSEIALHITIRKNQRSETDPIILQDLIDYYFKKELIEDFICEESNCPGTSAKKQIKLCLPLPNTICIHLQRLHYTADNIMKKVEDKVKFEEKIIIRKAFCKRSDNSFSELLNEYDYHLKSVIAHYGNASFGHYICYKKFNNSWFYTSDSFIYKEDIDHVFNCQAYILFYEKDMCDTNFTLPSNPDEEISQNKCNTYNMRESVNPAEKSIYQNQILENEDNSMEVDFGSQNNVQGLVETENWSQYSNVDINNIKEITANPRFNEKENFYKNLSLLSNPDKEISQNKSNTDNLIELVKPMEKSIYQNQILENEDKFMEVEFVRQNNVQGLVETENWSQYSYVDINNKKKITANPRFNEKDNFYKNPSLLSNPDKEMSQNYSYSSYNKEIVEPVEKSIFQRNILQDKDNSTEYESKSQNTLKGLAETESISRYSNVDINSENTRPNKNISELYSKLNDSSKDSSNFCSSKETLSITFEDNVLIQALSSCDNFLQSIRELSSKNFPEKNKNFLNFILEKNSPFDFPSSSSKMSFCILGNLKTIINQLFGENSQTNSSIESPLHFNLEERHKCYCKNNNFKCVKSEFVLQLSYLSDVQRSLDSYFTDIYYPKNLTFICCGFNIRLLEPLPKIICIQSEMLCSFRFEESMKIKIKSSYLCPENLSFKSSNYRGAYCSLFSTNVPGKDYEYHLKSFVTRNRGVYQCYRVFNGEWFHVTCNEIKKVNYIPYSYSSEVILFYEIHVEKRMLQSTENPNEKFSYPITQKESKISNTFTDRSKFNPENFNLKMCFHALSSCKSVINNKYLKCADNKMEKSISLLKVLKSLDNQSDLAIDVMETFPESFETNMYHLLILLLSNLSKEWNHNPFLISRDKTIECYHCGILQSRFLESQMSFNIPITSSLDHVNIQDFVDKDFQIQTLNYFECPRGECMGKTSKMLSKLCKPFPTVICIQVERVVWDGEKNKVFNPIIGFPECIQLKKKYFYITPDVSNTDKDLYYTLQSVISFPESTDPIEYFCYNNVFGNWSKITKFSKTSVNKYEIMSCNPYIMLYELDN